MTQTVWILYEVETMTIQHTGLDESKEVKLVMSKKPSLAKIAPYLAGLSGDMGSAINQVSTLLGKGTLHVREGIHYELEQHEVVSL